MKLGIVSTLALGCWLLGAPALAGDRAPSTLPRSPVPPDAPRVFTATEDIAPPYEVTCEVKGDSILAYINGVFVQKMVVPPGDKPDSNAVLGWKRILERTIGGHSIIIILKRGGIHSFPVSQYSRIKMELEAIRQGKSISSPYLDPHVISAIKREVE